MKTTRNAMAVGVLTVLILSGLYLAIQFVSDNMGSDGQYRVWAVFPDASGLHERSHVRIAGLKVGSISTIKLENYKKKIKDETTGNIIEKDAVGARVDFLISSDVVLYGNAKALRAADSLLGDQLVVIQPGDATQPVLEDGDQIRHTGDAGLMGNIDKITADISEVTDNLKQVFGSDEGARQMAEVLENLRDISKSINELVKNNQETVNRTLSNVDGIASDVRPGVRDIVRDLKDITREVRYFVEANRAVADDAVSEASGTVKDIRQTVATLDKTIQNLNEVVEGVNRGEGTVGRLLKDDKLIDDVESTVEEVGNTVEEVGDLVGGITKLKTIVGLASEYNVLTNSLRTGVQLRLQPREDKYYLIEAAYDARGVTTHTETIVETTNPDEPAQYREVKHVTRDSLLFSLMYARRIHFATFRFGIRDNSGGLGLDIHLIRDRLELSTDIYRFSDDVFPRLRQLVAFEFLKHLYITGGVNDILNENRDYFVGLMLRFDDEDLKMILPFVPAG